MKWITIKSEKDIPKEINEDYQSMYFIKVKDSIGNYRAVRTSFVIKRLLSEGCEIELLDESQDDDLPINSIHCSCPYCNTKFDIELKDVFKKKN